MDAWIAMMQEWLDDTYGGRFGYTPTPGDGRTGWPTMYSMTRAMQLELGISQPSDAFGPGTRNEYQAQIGSVSAATAQSHPNIIGILRMALWCKGYYSGYLEPDYPQFLNYTDDVENAIRQIRIDLGIDEGGGTTVKVMASLLSMDAYTLLFGGDESVRGVQQWLNGRYHSRRDFPLVPCDGVYTRQVQTGLLFAVQYEIGMTDGVANANFGPGTQQGVRDYGTLPAGSVDGARRLISVFQSALILSGHTTVPLNGALDSATQTHMQQFQQFVALPVSSGTNYATWAALLVSTGDPDRPVTGADTATQIDSARATTLYTNGFRVVGRYINGTTKRLMHNEPAILQVAGLRWFPIYQEWNNSADWFSPELGKGQGMRIATRARALGIPGNTIIFLSVDYDPLDEEISAIVIPHFKAARLAMDRSRTLPLRLGVYGTRNVCARLSEAGITAGSFVADMSTGWSGNLGFGLPSDWMYDQIKTATIGTGAGLIEIDRVAMSPNADSLNNSALTRTPREYNDTAVTGYDENVWWKFTTLQDLAESVSGTTNELAANFILYDIHRFHYGKQAGHDLMNVAWDTVFCPPPTVSADSQEIYRYEQFEQLVRDEYPTLQGSVFGETADGSVISVLGDVPHAAVVARAYVHLGTPVGSTWGLVDFGAWAGDLATAWADYEKARLSGTADDAYTYMRSKIGAPAGVGETFGEADLRADCVGYLMATDLRQADPPPLSEVVRRILVGTNDDPGWIAKAFLASRFGSHAVAVETAEAILRADIPHVAVGGLYDGYRRPGKTHDEHPYPNASVRATEVNACARAFADALVGAQADWSLRS